jgi:hypothetical protein
MPINCQNYKENVLAQTLFLGASVVSFSSNVGWGGKASSLTVELIEDFQPNIFANIPHYNANSYPLNHYYNCIGDDCYVDEFGNPYSSSLTKKEKNAPGKIFYRWVGNAFVSSYWVYEDPGFFATGTYVQPDGTVNRNGPINIYDIIDTPVYFKFDNFEFIGLVRSWERNNRPGGVTYSVQIESFDSLLDNSKIILQDFDGAVTSAKNARLSQGNIANIFNVYGFLESMGYNRFGGAALNENGISAKAIIDSIHALTANVDGGARDEDGSYSPFGRILSKSIRRVGINYNGVNEPHLTTMNTFGVITAAGPVRGFTSLPYNSFSLDLSSLPTPPYDYRISGSPDKSLSEFISTIVEDTGLDFLTVVVPVKANGGIEFIIKVVTVNRTQYNPTYQIPAVVSNLETSGFNVENSSFGQETNQNSIRKVVFGGNQQRFYQAKTYRLAYAQNNYIWNPIVKRFINNRRSISKIRNPFLRSNKINNITIDPYWGDAEIGRPESVIGGNYFLTRIFRNNPGTRFIPLFRDVICPYFGTKLDVTYGSTSDSNIFRFVRPVYLDTWTNQITIAFDLNELPSLSIGEPLSMYDGSVASTSDNEKTSSTPKSEDASGETDDASDDEKKNDDSEGGTEEEQKETENSPPNGSNSDSEGSGAPDKLSGVGFQGSSTAIPEIGVSVNNRGSSPPPPPPPSPSSEQSAQNIITFTPLFIAQEDEEEQGEETSPSTDSPELERPKMSDEEPGWNNRGEDNNNPNAQKRDEDAADAQQEQSSDDGSGSSDDGSGSSDSSSTPAAESDRNVVRTLEYKSAGFTIKETELRCSGFDEYLTYCLGKSYFSKPDLFVMLVNAYKAKNIFLEAKPPPLPGEPISTVNLGGGMGGAGTNLSSPSIAEDGHMAEPRNALHSKMQMNWDLYLNHNFIKDLQLIHGFIQTIASKYYGKQYMVKMPDVYAYKDTAYIDIAIPGTTSSFFVYHGSQNIRYNFEIADGGWEEPGNYIDDSFVFGDNYWHALRNDDGLLGPILGYNVSPNIDDVTCSWAKLDNNTKKAIITKRTKTNAIDRSNYASDPTVRDLQGKIDNLKYKIRSLNDAINKKNQPKPEDAKKPKE